MKSYTVKCCNRINIIMGTVCILLYLICITANFFHLQRCGDWNNGFSAAHIVCGRLFYPALALVVIMAAKRKQRRPLYCVVAFCSVVLILQFVYCMLLVSSKINSSNADVILMLLGPYAVAMNYYWFIFSSLFTLCIWICSLVFLCKEEN